MAEAVAAITGRRLARPPQTLGGDRKSKRPAITRNCEFAVSAVRKFVYCDSVIKSFADTTTETIFHGELPDRKEIRKLGGLNIPKAFERLSLLDAADEKRLLRSPFLHYHRLKGSDRYSIDADSRRSPWRITFQWENDEMKDGLLVRIEDPH